MQSPAIFTGWSRSLRRNKIPQRKDYLWDGLLNPTVYVSYLLEIVFLLLVSLIKLS